MKKIDAHLHLAKVIAGYCRRGELRATGAGKAMWGNGEEFQLLPKEYGDKEFLAEKALEIMAKNGVEKAVLMQGSMYGFQNQYHYEILLKYPQKFCPSCTVDPYMTNHLETLEMYLTEMKFRLVKFEISSGGGLMGCHDPFSLMSERMQKIYALIEKNNGIVALDVGDITMPSHQPANIAKIADTYPNLKIVVCHLLAPTQGRYPEWIESLKLLKKKNVWFDIAALPKVLDVVYPYREVHEVLKIAKDIVGADRIMWGTDAPFAATRDSYEKLTDYLIENDIFTSAELESIYYHNANNLYFTER